jgi:NAD(P)-dependent dehydrogenase (short-subunit alcohol dehydrogenase family)
MARGGSVTGHLRRKCGARRPTDAMLHQVSASALQAFDPAMPVTLVIGGVAGLGLATALALRQSGHEVHVTWRLSAEAASEAERHWPRGVWRLDMAQAAAIQGLIAGVLQRSGRLDHLVVCPGDYAVGSLEGLTPQALQALWESNVAQPLEAFAAARQALRASRGSAVFFGCAGLDGHAGKRSSAAYAATKSALWVLVRSLALEEGPHGVRVNLVSPGWIPHEQAHPQTQARAGQVVIPLGRPGKPEDVAGAVAYLLSSAAEYVSGTNLTVSGGL